MRSEDRKGVTERVPGLKTRTQRRLRQDTPLPGWSFSKKRTHCVFIPRGRGLRHKCTGPRKSASVSISALHPTRAELQGAARSSSWTPTVGVHLCSPRGDPHDSIQCTKTFALLMVVYIRPCCSLNVHDQKSTQATCSRHIAREVWFSRWQKKIFSTRFPCTSHRQVQGHG